MTALNVVIISHGFLCVGGKGSAEPRMKTHETLNSIAAISVQSVHSCTYVWTIWNSFGLHTRIKLLFFDTCM